ncbi:MAG: 4-(cytidine 5'-diphospho)-2-C-methyl-D-erythritol kinase [Ignavibacteriales bacterium]|nr:4-(cytidine 5'-diphospho)-2-C-methyl-D-erythritol kinase [Ignavibacteriales bacterium]
MKAYAKINLGLHIVGKREDGFHNIETIFHRINLSDEITIRENDTIALTVSNSLIPSNKDNLCWKAVELLQQKLQTSRGVTIHIQKNIPVGAGLGGGSSDAAAVLQSLPMVWNKQIDKTALETLALHIGSDVPYFLGKQTAYAEGRGEKLSYVQIGIPYWIVLVNPGIHLSTQWAYKTLSEQRNGTFPVRTSLANAFSLSPMQCMITAENDFEEIVFAAHPHIGEIKKKLLQLHAINALMSGSGSSVFGLFEHESDASKAMAFFGKDHFVHLTEPNFIPE